VVAQATAVFCTLDARPHGGRTSALDAVGGA